MDVRYIFLFVIPVLFVLTSCTTKERNLEGFFDFSSGIRTGKEITTNEVKPTQNQPETKHKAEEKPISKKNIPETERTYPVKRYHLGYLAFDVADIYGEFTELGKTADYTRYKFRFYSHTNGFLDYLFGWMSHTVSTMKVYNDRVVPETFQTKSVLKKKTKEIAISYDDTGRISFEQVTPPDNRGKRPTVDNKLKIDTYDPLSIAVEARRIVMAAFRNDYFKGSDKYNFTLPLYDGRRRSDVNFELSKNKVHEYYHLKFTQKAIAGYTQNELNDIKKGEKSIDLYVDTKDFWPVIAEGSSPVGYARAKLVEGCTEVFEDCIKR